MRFVILAFSQVVTYYLFSQHTISGRVVDAETKEGLIGAHVYLLNDWRNGTIAGLEGQFSLVVGIKDSKDSIIVSYVGFKERVVPIEDELVVGLEAIEQQGEVVVVTAKPLIAEEFQYIKIKKMDIYTNPAAKADPILAVNSLPSSTTTDESANISLRGSSPVETGIFLNNVPLYDAVRYSQLNGIGTFSIFNTAIIEEVTVFPGNPPLEFGNVTSGVIALDTDRRILEGNTNSLILSLANIGFSREQKLSKNQSLKLFTNWQPSSAIKKLNERALENIESFSSTDAGLYWYGATKSLSWKVFGYSNSEQYEFNFEHPSFQGIFDQQKVRSFLISTTTFPLSKGELSLNNGVSLSHGAYGYSNVAFTVDKRDFFGGINYHLEDPKFSFKSGLSLDHRFAQVNGNFHQYAYALRPEHPTIPVNEEMKLNTLEGFLYFKYYLSDAFAIGTGARKNIPTDSVNYLSSQLNLAYTLGNWSTTFGIGKYHKAGLFENTGDPFRSESNQVSVDVKYQTNSLHGALSFFNNHADINGSTYDAKGVELFGAYRLSAKLTATGSFTWLDANYKNEDNHPFDLAYFVRGNFSYTPGKYWTIESILNLRQGTLFYPVTTTSFDAELDVFQPIYSETGLRLPAYWNVGLSISKVFLVSEDFNFIAFLSLNNVFDHENVSSYRYSSDYSSSESNLFSQRTGYIGLVINF